MELTTYQNFVIDEIYNLLNSEHFRKNFNKPGFKEFFNMMIRKYPEITSLGDNTWKNTDYYLKYFQISERAINIMRLFSNEKELWRKVHYEHIYPNSLIIKELLNLKIISKQSIKEVMKKSRIVILSKEEAKVLDGSPSKEYLLDGTLVYGKGLRSKGSPEERLNSIGAIISKDTYYNTLFSN